ncbi:MAG: hypothetical protein Q9160_003877 [Pyrenula sp. 1 TL-2023]
MADGALSAISLGIEVTRGLYTYFKSIRELPDEANRILSSTENLRLSLDRIRIFIENSNDKRAPEAVTFKAQLEQNVASCEEAFKRLDREYRKLIRDPNATGIKSAMKHSSRLMAYPFRKDALRALESAVADARSNLAIGISASLQDHLDFMHDLI